MVESVIVSGMRTPIGSFQGGLSLRTAPQLGSVAIAGAVEAAKIDPAVVAEVYMGCVLTAGLGQAPARQAAIGAGIPVQAGAMTLNKVCGSGLKAVALADQAIRCGDVEVAVAGGMESMSNAPYLLPKARSGYRLGHGHIIDSMICDGLWDPYHDFHMGAAGERCATEFQYTREAQDDFALESYRRAQAAMATGAFTTEIVPVAIPQRTGEPVQVTTDEEPGRIDAVKFRTVRPAFATNGTITAGNASSLSDGAAALLLMSAARATTLGCRPLARILAQACVSQAPEWFTTAPAAVIPVVCAKAGLRVAEIDLFEINEAFSCVTMHAMRTCALDPQQVNVHGGAVALGHPIGASGARILVTLLHALERHHKRLGLATLCNGGGEALAIIIERCT
ncbi:MAG: acetyl-CoA C-acyltransferase [Deltaproteobacteria bacterium]|nr:acetyl-CoA C-acyltransferase [Deltaproteobacteria bacterium]